MELLQKKWTEPWRDDYVYHADYLFRLTTYAASQPLTYQGTDEIDSDVYQSLTPDAVVPVIYDPLAPEQSKLNFGDRVHRDNPFATFWMMFGTMGTIDALLLLVFGWFLGKTYWREKRLLRVGQPVSASIVDEREYIARGVRVADVTYRFVDAAGRTVEATQKAVPGKNRGRSQSDEYRDNPTVIFDPSDSAVSALYPLSSVDLA